MTWSLSPWCSSLAWMSSGQCGGVRSDAGMCEEEEEEEDAGVSQKEYITAAAVLELLKLKPGPCPRAAENVHVPCRSPPSDVYPTVNVYIKFVCLYWHFQQRARPQVVRSRACRGDTTIESFEGLRGKGMHSGVIAQSWENIQQATSIIHVSYSFAPQQSRASCLLQPCGSTIFCYHCTFLLHSHCGSSRMDSLGSNLIS